MSCSKNTNVTPKSKCGSKIQPQPEQEEEEKFTQENVTPKRYFPQLFQ